MQNLRRLKKTVTLGASCSAASSIQAWTLLRGSVEEDRSASSRQSFHNEKPSCLLNFIKTKRYFWGVIHLNPNEIYFIIFNSLLTLCICVLQYGLL